MLLCNLKTVVNLLLGNLLKSLVSVLVSNLLGQESLPPYNALAQAMQDFIGRRRLNLDLDALELVLVVLDDEVKAIGIGHRLANMDQSVAALQI